MAERRVGARSLLAGAAALLAGAAAYLVVRDRQRGRRRELRDRVAAEHAGRLPRVVVLGGGAGGLFCALGLKDAPVETLVIDRTNHYVYESLLYQVATGQLDEADVSLPLRDALARVPNARPMMAEVNGIDLERREVHLRDQPHSVLYDYLVIATGLEPDYFGHPEWVRKALPIKTLADAIELRDHILSSLELAEMAEDETTRTALSTFVLVGGGPTGVEMAGALSEMLRAAGRKDFERYDPSRGRVVLVEAGARLLPTFAEGVAAKVRGKLEAMGVEVLLAHPVTAIDDGGVTIDGTRIESRNVVWTAGMHATPMGALAGLPTDRSGRIAVHADLTVPDHPEVYAIGDVAHVEQDGVPLPGIAPVALEEAAFAAKAIARAVEGRPRGRAFRYMDRGTVATVGRGYGVWEAARGRVRVTGLPAKLVWIAAHLLFQVPAGDRTRMFTKWTWVSLTSRLRSHVITGPDSRTAEARDHAMLRPEREPEPTARR